MATTITKYNSVLASLHVPMPAWVTDPDDQVRIAAYDAYSDMYDNVPNTFKLTMRGTNDVPIYVPSTKRIVEATNRYLAKCWGYTVASASINEQAVQAGKLWLDTTSERNRLDSKFLSLKRNTLKKGDGVFHVFANMDKPAGERIRIAELNPRCYFRIEDPTDPENLLGVYIVNQIVVGEQHTQVAMRQEYRTDPEGSTLIFSKLTFWEPAGWDDRFPGHPDLKPVPVPPDFDTPGNQAMLEGMILPDSVTKIPVYHAANNRSDEDPWGTSEVSGMETLVAAINQAVSDEDITLALQGLGMYVTTSSAPINADTGEAEDWVISPASVLEIKMGTTFNRVDGVKGVLPFQDHIHTLTDAIDKASGVTATAMGNVDVAVAASGIALRLDMAPILAKNQEKEIELKAIMNELTRDLVKMWAPVDGVSLADDLTVNNTFDDPLPVDRAAVVLEVSSLVAAGLMSKEFAITYLSEKLGYQFPAEMLDQISAAADAESARVAAEIAANTDPTADPSGPPQPGTDPTGAVQ